MRVESETPQILLPKAWQGRVKSAVVHVISLAHYAIVYARAWAADSINARVRLAAENDRLHEECSLLHEPSLRAMESGRRTNRGTNSRRAFHRNARFTYSHILRMVCHTKTTSNIDDSVMKRLRQESAKTGRTISELVESALRMCLRRSKPSPKLPPLPAFDSGGAKVDVADREALYQVMGH